MDLQYWYIKKPKPKHFSLSALNKTNKILTWIYNLMIFGWLIMYTYI